MKLKKILIVTGDGKDADGICRKKIREVMDLCGAVEVDTPEKAELVLVLGGDGTIMHAAHTAQKYNIPLIGINLGRIGYLAELEVGELDRLADIFNGNYTTEKRMMLTVKHGRDVYTALNDVVIRAESIHPISVTVHCDGRAVNTYRGDGLICSTPTGSTAYSVSAGGSVIDPRVECIALTPLCTQSLIARPLIFSPECTLTFTAIENHRSILTIDGEHEIALSSGDIVTVAKCDRLLCMLRISSDNFYDVLNKKLYI